MRNGRFASALVGVLLIIPSIAACSLGQYSCTKAGGHSTDELLSEIEALGSTNEAFIVACDSGDPSTVYFASASSSQLADELVSQKGCREVAVALPENDDGMAYDCRFQAGTVEVWVEKDPTRGSNSAHVTSPS